MDDEENFAALRQLKLQQAGFDAITAPDGAQALALLAREPRDLVITDLKMPGMSGLELLKRIKDDFPEIIVIVVTAFGTIESAVEAMRSGAFDYLIKPVNTEALRLIVSRALEYHRLRKKCSISGVRWIESSDLRAYSENPRHCWLHSTMRREPPKATQRC